MSETKSPQQIVDGIQPYLPANPTVDSEPQLLKMVSEIKAYGREKKINGAKSFAKLVKEMRAKQEAYFRNHSSNNQASRQLLYEAKKLEDQVDTAVEAILK